MQYKFVINLTSVRTETMEGREYWVAPMVMMTEGVHAGSNGPILYLGDDLDKACIVWNHKPIVVNHPELNGQFISAASPEVIERQKIGLVLNTRWDNKAKKQRAEAWIEKSRAKKVDERVYNALDQGKMMELSTGLVVEPELVANGNWNGESYTSIARNHKPDHLAILPDKVGACSIADGAGLLQCNQATSKNWKEVGEAVRKALLAVNAMSHNNIYTALSSALRDKFGSGIKEWNGWIEDVYDGFFVYWNDGQLYRLKYLATDTEVSLVGDPDEVQRVTEYRTVADSSFVGNTTVGNTKESIDMDKTKVVDGLIANTATKWEEKDRAFLLTMNEEQLGKLTPTSLDTGSNPAAVAAAAAAGGAGIAPAAPVVNAGVPAPAPAPAQTLEQLIANANPVLQEVIRNGVVAYNDEKAKLIATITANTANKFTPEYLQTVTDLNVLKGIAALAAPVAQPAQMFRSPIYNGAAGPLPITNAGGEEESLGLPTMDFSGKA